MSGFNRARGEYDLTPTKASYWHRSRNLTGAGCGCRHAGDMVLAHVVPAGFTVVDHGSYWSVGGLSVAEGWTADLYESLSGRPGDKDPDRQWKF